MIKTLMPAVVIIAALTSCSSLKPVSMGSKQIASTPVQVATHNSKEVKFLDDISVTAQSPASNNKNKPVAVKKESSVKPTLPAPKPADNNNNDGNTALDNSIPAEKMSELELKYSALLNVETDLLTNAPLLEHIDEWYGTRYRMGGTTKNGIDCSAFVQTIYLSAFGVALPRTAREQYKSSHIISATELEEGDLVFFNTRGGVSHVGIYLQNNKFVHASVSSGVTISDMYDPYYMKHFIGAGRIERPEAKNFDQNAGNNN
jgi:cell wall-associated NlpC family hydrolase